MKELACTRELKSYAGDSLAAGTASHTGQVSSDSVIFSLKAQVTRVENRNRLQ